jgi:hypothetical protein
MTFRHFIEYGTQMKATAFGAAGRLGQSQATPEKFVKPVIPRSKLIKTARPKLF